MNALPTMTGIDVYHGDQVNDWNQVSKYGIKFAFLKASEATALPDRAFINFRINAQSAGIPCGAYHFFHGDLSGSAQAAHFLDVIKKVSRLELPCVLDWELLPKIHIQNQVAIQNALAFLRTVEEATGVIPIIYGSPSFLTDLKLPNFFSRYPLWIAEYETSKPKIPTPWNKWTFWQYSESNHVSGISNPADMNLFIGVKADLLNLSKNIKIAS